MIEQQLQTQLLHPVAPPPVSWWPPAPGWWALTGFLLLLLLLLPWLRHSLRRHKSRRRRQARQVLAEIPDHLPDAQWLAAVNVRIKQLLRQRGDEAATRLYGDVWLDYLCSRHPNSQRNALQPLAEDLYRPDLTLSPEQRQMLLRELRRWMRHNNV